jgi:hypothetical protein
VILGRLSINGHVSLYLANAQLIVSFKKYRCSSIYEILKDYV